MLCGALIKIREATATKQSFQNPSPGFPGCRDACTDTQNHWCGNYYCPPIIVIVMPIRLPLCKFLEGRDHVSGCFSWIHAFMLPFTHPTNIYWVLPSLCPPQCRGLRRHIPSYSPAAQPNPGCQPQFVLLGMESPQTGHRLEHLHQPKGQEATGGIFFLHHLLFLQTPTAWSYLLHNKNNLINSTF